MPPRYSCKNAIHKSWTRCRISNFFWHAILDFWQESRPHRRVQGANRFECAAPPPTIGKSQRHMNTIRTPLKTYKDVVAASIYLLEHFDAAVDAAAADAERCARENKFHGHTKDRAGRRQGRRLPKLLTKHGDRMKQAMERIRTACARRRRPSATCRPTRTGRPSTSASAPVASARSQRRALKTTTASCRRVGARPRMAGSSTFKQGFHISITPRAPPLPTHSRLPPASAASCQTAATCRPRARQPRDG